MAGNSAPKAEELTRYALAFRAVAEGADELALRINGYRLLMGADRAGTSPRRFERWAEVVAAVEDLAGRKPALDDHTERYLEGMLRALHTFARVRDGAVLAYLEQVEAYLELPDIWVPDEELDALRARISYLLAELGIAGDFPTGLRTWEQARTVRTDEIAAAGGILIEPSKRASIAYGVPVPEEAAVDIAVRSSPYYAYAHYHGNFSGTVELTSDLLWTYEGIKHSICHEAFPGHQASASAKEAAVRAGTWSPLALPGLANTPVSPIVEGVAECGVEILGWISTLHDELFGTYSGLLFAVRTNAAILRHQYGEPRERAIAYMVAEGATPEDWAVYHERFITDPLWHTSFPHYWHGAKLIRAARDQFRGRERDLYAELYSRPHTTSTLRSLLAADVSRRSAEARVEKSFDAKAELA